MRGKILTRCVLRQRGLAQEEDLSCALCGYLEENFDNLFSIFNSILVNGSPIEPIVVAFRALRHGDPLSPFIFMIVGEGLNKLIAKACNSGIVHRFEVVGGGLVITHLQFAGYTLLFCDTMKEELQGFKTILSVLNWCLG